MYLLSRLCNRWPPESPEAASPAVKPELFGNNCSEQPNTWGLWGLGAFCYGHARCLRALALARKRDPHGLMEIWLYLNKVGSKGGLVLLRIP